MENASQALLIAAGILMALIILTVIIFGFRQVSNYYTAKEQNKASEQLSAFNKQYDSYAREDVRGTELISLIYKIIDFNTTQDDPNSDIEISVNIKDGGEKYKNIYYDNSYDNSGTRLIDYKTTYKQGKGETNLSTMLSEAREIEASFPSGIPDKLANNIATVLGKNGEARQKQFLKELLKKEELSSDEEKNLLKYYQYQQFKRAHFNCKGLEYTAEGRVKKFNFVFNGSFE